MTELKAGEYIELSCPDGSTVQLQSGDLIPAGKDPLFFVAKAEGPHVKLGPLIGGKLVLEIPCSNGTTVSEEFYVQPISQFEKPDAYPPLSPVKVNYPDLSMHLLILLAVILISIFSFFYLRRDKKRKHQEEISEPEIVLTPKEELARFVEQSLKSNFFTHQDSKDIHKFYDQSYRLLRDFLEDEFKLDTEFETTREFLGTLRVIGKKRGLGERLSSRLESVFEFADRVRFAAGRPQKEEQEQYLKEYVDIYEKISRGAKE